MILDKINVLRGKSMNETIRDSIAVFIGIFVIMVMIVIQQEMDLVEKVIHLLNGK